MCNGISFLSQLTFNIFRIHLRSCQAAAILRAGGGEQAAGWRHGGGGGDGRAAAARAHGRGGRGQRHARRHVPQVPTTILLICDTWYRYQVGNVVLCKKAADLIVCTLCSAPKIACKLWRRR